MKGQDYSEGIETCTKEFGPNCGTNENVFAS